MINPNIKSSFSSSSSYGFISLAIVYSPSFLLRVCIYCFVRDNISSFKRDYYRQYSHIYKIIMYISHNILLSLQVTTARTAMSALLNNTASLSRLSGNRKPQIRFWGNRHSDGGNRCHISFRMYDTSFDVNTFWRRSWVWPNIGRFLSSAAWISANSPHHTASLHQHLSLTDENAVSQSCCRRKWRVWIHRLLRPWADQLWYYQQAFWKHSHWLIQSLNWL